MEAAINLPQDVETLQEMVRTNQEQIRLMGETIRLMEEKIRLMTAAAYGKKSERMALESLGQQTLFEAEAVALDAPEKTTKIEAHQRKKPVRKPLPVELPRKEIVHDLSEAEKVCDCGAAMCCIGRNQVEKLSVQPERVFVEQHIELKYACKSCDGLESNGPVVRGAKMPPQLLPKSYASADLLAFLVVSKYVDALPLHRLEKRFGRWNVKLSKKTMTDWMLKLGKLCDALVRLMLIDIRDAPWIGIDETPIRIVEKKKKTGKAKSGWIWVLHCKHPRPMSLFFYDESRSSAFPKRVLKDYQGVVISDDWKAYHFLDLEKPAEVFKAIISARCWVHARRYFDRVIKATQAADWQDTITGRTLLRIKKIYKLESDATKAEYTQEQRMEMRSTITRPVLEDMKKDLLEMAQSGSPVGALKTAVDYTLKNWKGLTHFLEHPIPLDNNGSENAIRPYVVGRKNWLFACSTHGAEANATFYTLVETAKANGWNTYTYLRHLFENLPLANNDDDLRALLPTVPPTPKASS